uniref:NADH-ubiquinone oxidoreductase chain 5 n=1 Tax=Dolichosciara megumiae TaxID=2715056 RepID=A0A6G7GC75_9DIPT|nr:NADH dehydrogenase subunit 5 [Dolichosciara megumiae]QIH95784.1 NADH dehydrogenase subunit 5 [Dolichosciara megumiae]
MLKMSICLISFFSLILFSLTLLVFGMVFLYYDMIYFIEWEVLSLNTSSIVMTFLFDWMSLLFMSFVLLISSLVILYSKEYMAEDKFINRFISLVLMFVLSMMMLIISPNLISILLGWDGLGLVSYCLVIYFQNIKSFNAGMLTALSNRIGDVALLMAIAWMLNYGSWNYIFYLEFKVNDLSMSIVGGLIMLAAMTKSAQIPFSSWLPAAMAAPTPVSALVHSSTLVTAGVYLLIRFNYLLLDNMLGQFLLLIAGLTMFMSGLGANFEFDLKKIIALSTLSQLGLMMMILSMGYSKLAFFHLLTHAMFKALLFMCAGSIIHNMMNSQDIRSMGGLCLNMPLTSSFFNISNLALCGMPFMAGFYSKDLILEMASFSYINMYIYIIYFFSTGLTVSYSFRLVYYSMVGDFNTMALHPMNDESWLMLKSMMTLVMMSMFSGSLLMWLMFPSPLMISLTIYMKLTTLIVCLIGGFTGYFMSMTSLFFFNKSLYLNKVVSFFMMMWFMPYISTTFIIKMFFKMGGIMKLMDQGWSEYFGSNKLFNSLMTFSQINQVVHHNNVKLYLFSFMIWFFFFFFFFL